jgi:PAS domain S-box-containing protein
MDMMERKRAEGALQARELNLRLILDSIPAPVAVMTPCGQVESVNHLVIEYFGKTFEELKRWGTSDAVHPDDLPRAIAVWQEAIETGQPYDVKERLRRFDGVYRWFGVRGFPLRDPGGRILNWCVLLSDIDDRERAEEALRQSEQRWRTAFENSAISIMMRNLEGRFIAANSVFQNMLGYTESELCQLNFMDVTHEEDCKGELQLVAEILEGKRQHYQIEKRYRRKDGTVFWVRNNVALVPGMRDAAPFLFAVVEDITQRKQEESARRYSEERYSVVVETANDAVVSADESGAIQFANPATTRVFGYDPAELIGKPLTVLMPEFMRKLHENGFRRYLATGQRHINWQGTELVGLRKNGQEFPLEVSFGELTTNGRRVFTGFIRDITERKQAEDTFRLIVAGTAATTGSDFFQSLVQHMAQALRARYAFVTTCDDQKHARSLAFWKGDGFGEDFEFDIADTPCEKVLHGTVCHYRQGLQGLFPDDKLLADWQAESYLGVPMLDRSNRVIGHIAILDSKPMEADLRTIDLLKIFASRAAAELKRQRAEDQLQAALQERERLRNVQAELAHVNRVNTMGELTASLAHEIKQPISAAMTDAQTCMRWLACERPEVAEAREAASRLVKDATRANEIIGRIGSLFKKHVPMRELIDVNEVIREMIGLMRSEASRHSISIRSELADGLPQIMADRVGLQQVLMNLMLNGVEAMKDMTAPGTLTIVSRRSEDSQLTVSILDTGVGVSPEQVDKIFSAFVTSKAQGTGMGLPICRSIIESHGGRLWATPNTGPGATFQFALPIERSAQQTA